MQAPHSMKFSPFMFPYTCNPSYAKRVAYFSMEYAIDQSLKIYSGGLGFLSGSHMRSAYSLKQHMVGVGILWKYGYYDQGRNEDQTLRIDWQQKMYFFLEDVGLKFTVKIYGADIWVKAYYLAPEVFNTAPLFLLSTDLPENDYLSKTICHRLYDTNAATKLAQYMLLGLGGAMLLGLLHWTPEIYHLNEAHALPAALYLLNKFNRNIDEVKRHLVFTTHTPEDAGNEKHPLDLCEKAGFFQGMDRQEIDKLLDMPDDHLNLSLAALRLSKKANGVSRLHGQVARAMWEKYTNTCTIDYITNAQNFKYWADPLLHQAKEQGDIQAVIKRKQALKKQTFEEVANQCGKLFRPEVFTLVWARRFAGYKRADLLIRHMERFEHLVQQTKYPIQIIWAGKPFPFDEGSVYLFNKLVHLSHRFPNIGVLTGYELKLSKLLKQGADAWLNNPRVPREASGTSGMTAAMNGAINLTTSDGWIPEFIKDGINGFAIPTADYLHTGIDEQDEHDNAHLYHILEDKILPLYYAEPTKWCNLVMQSMSDVQDAFDSDRMAIQYYEKLYEFEA